MIDNISFYRTIKIKQIYSDTNIKLVYLPLYSLDLNLIKEFFSELKQFIKQK